MIVYLLTVLIVGLLCVGIIWCASRIAPIAAPQANTRYAQENAPRLEIQPHRGDYSAWQASSIEGECDHV